VKREPARILITARDPGAAGNLIPLAESLMGRREFSVSIFAMDPGYSIMRGAGLPVQWVSAAAYRAASDCGASILLQEARRVLASINPEIVVAGVSGPEIGLDEACLCEALTPHTYAIQDFWGDVNIGLGRVAGRYFVMDAEADRLTRLRYPVQTTISGLPKYVSFKEFQPASVRHRIRGELTLSERDRLFVVFGQPLWQVAGRGYPETLLSLARSLFEFDEPFRILYRSHPKEDPAMFAETRKIFQSVGLEIEHANRDSTMNWLMACDVCFTCYSNCGYDLVMLKKLFGDVGGIPVHLMFEKEIIKLFSSYTHIDRLPSVTEGFALEVSDSASLRKVISSALNPEVRNRMRERIARFAPSPENAVRVIVGTILSEYTHGKKGETDIAEWMPCPG